jgi:hypothetical protein
MTSGVRQTLAVLALGTCLQLALADGYSRNSRLVGRWIHDGPDSVATLALAADGTWSGTVTLRGQPEAQFEGKWLTDKDYIYWLYTKSSTPKVKPGARDKDKLMEIGDDYFVLHTRDNREPKYVRTK